MIILKYGSRGKEVRRLQTLLNRNGCQPPLKVDGVFGAMTLAAVEQFQAANRDREGNPLTIDGVVGPKTWWALEAALKDEPLPKAEPPLGPFLTVEDEHRLRIAQVALNYANQGIAEDPLGSNGGDGVDQFLEPFREIIGQERFPWCAAFVWKCVTEADIPWPKLLPNSNVSFASAWAWKRMGELRNEWHSNDGQFIPKRGDIFVMKGEHYHVGIVRNNFGNGKIYTIEGNSSNRLRGGDNDPMTRRLQGDGIQGFVRIQV